MRFTPPGRLKTAEEFRALWRQTGSHLDCTLEPRTNGALSRAITIGERTLSNRFCIHPMEGWDGTQEGLPSAHTLRRWTRFGRSGAALIWGGEAFAVRASGRANPNQLYLNDAVDIAGGLENLLAALRAENDGSAVTGLQLTHSGRFCRPEPGPMQPKIMHHHPVLARKYRLPDDLALLTDDELHTIRDDFIVAARLAQQVGFDFVDVKCCHGYLLHESLAAYTRDGQYGGSFENRTRLFREIIDGVRAECPGLAIGVRVSINDVIPFEADPETRIGQPISESVRGFGSVPEDDDPRRFIDLLLELEIALINVTIGSPYYCPHVQRPAAYPPSDGYLPPEDPLHGVRRHVEATRFVKQIAGTRAVVVGSGYSYLQEYLPHVADHEISNDHADFVGLGRMVLSYPELPRDFLTTGALESKRICRTFSDCTTGPRNGMISGCFPLDEYYKAMPEAQEIRVIRRGTPGA